MYTLQHVETFENRVRKKFGQRVRQLRKRLGISQEEFAEICGLHRTYIGDIERGVRNPSLINIVRIANALQVEPEELFKKVTGGNG